MKNDDNQLVIVARESGLELQKVTGLLASFGDSFDRAQTIVEEARSIVVTNEDQIQDMKDARNKRLELKEIRVEVEKRRKSLKEQSLREGKAIDGIANIIKAVIVPVEEHLELQEKFAEAQEAKRRQELYEERYGRISAIVSNPSIYKLQEMSNEEFEELVVFLEVKSEQSKKAAEQAEAERKEAEAQKKLEDERIRKENERLKAEALAREEVAAKERAAAAKKLEAERAANEQKLAKEREKREVLERAKREELERELETKRLKEKAERDALLAPDKEKITVFVASIKAVKYPELTSDSAKKLMTHAATYLDELMTKLSNAAKEL